MSLTFTTSLEERQDQYTNLSANPSYESAAGTVEVRRNRHPNPKFVAGGSVGVTQANTTVTLDTYLGRSMLKSVCTNVGASATRLHPNDKSIAAVQGQTVYSRVTVWNAAATARSFQSTFRSSSTAAGSATFTQLSLYNTTTQVIAAGASYTFEHSATITDATAASVIMSVTRTSASGQVGDTFYCEDVYFSNTEKLPSNEPVLTGDSPTTGDFSTVWAAVARQSDTIVTAPAISGLSNTNTAQRKAWQTSEQSFLGTKSLRNELVTTSGVGLQVASDVALDTGNAATLSFWVRPRDRTLNATARIRGTVGSVQEFPVGVWTQVRLTVNAGATEGSTGLVLAPASGHQVGDVIDIDASMLVPVSSTSVPYTGQYNDGNSVGWAWDGVPNNSTSSTTPTIASEPLEEVLPGWNVTEEATPIAVGNNVGSVSSGTIRIAQGQDSEFLINESAILEHPSLGTYSSRVSSATSNGATEATDTDIVLSLIGPGGVLTAEREAQLVNGLRTILPSGTLRQGNVENAQGYKPGRIAAKPGGLYRIDEKSTGGVIVVYVDRVGNRTEVQLTGSTVPATSASIIGFDVTNNAYVIFFVVGGVRRLGFYNITTGALITVVGSNGTGTGQFGGGGTDVVYWNAVSDVVYIADTSNFRVQRYTSLGSYIDSFPVVGTPPEMIIGTATNLYIYGVGDVQDIKEYSLTGSLTGKKIRIDRIQAMAISPDTGGIVTIMGRKVDLYSISLATHVASYEFDGPVENEVVRNLAPNPRGYAPGGAVPAFTNTSAATASWVLAPDLGGYGGVRFTRTSTATSRQAFEIPGLVASETYTTTMKVRSSVTTTVTLQYRPNLDTNANVVVIASVPLVAGVLTDLTYTFTALSSVDSTNPGIAFLTPSGVASGATLDVGMLMVVNGGTAVPFFYPSSLHFGGASPVETGFVTRWVGEPDASASIKLAQAEGAVERSVYLSSNTDFTYVFAEGLSASPWDYKVKLLAIGQATLYTAFAYYGTLGGIDEIIYRPATATYIPLPGWTDTPWNKIKELAAAYNVEVSFEDSIYTINSVGTRVLDLENVEGGSVSLQISTQQTAQTFDITYRQFEASTSGTFYNAADEGNMITFSPSSTPTFVTLNSEANQLASVYQPYQVNSAATARDTPGTFYISDSNGIRVTAAMFEEVAGSVSVSLDSPTSVTVAIELGDTIPGTSGSYKFAFGGSPRFSLSGAGIFGKPETITLYTGADPANTPPLKGPDVNNIFINNATMAYGRGIWRSEQLAGPQLVLSATVPTSSLDGFGITAGALVRFKDCIYRIDSVRIGNASSSITATRYVKQSDTQALHAGFTMGQVDEFWAGTKYKDQIIKPLKWPVTFQPLDEDGYGHGSYGHSPYGHAN